MQDTKTEELRTPGVDLNNSSIYPGHSLTQSAPGIGAPKVWHGSTWFVVAAVIAIILLLLFSFTPLSSFAWTFLDITHVLIDQVGLGSSPATVVAIPIAFLYAIAIPIGVRWLIFGRRQPLQIFFSFLAVFVLFGTKPLIRSFALSPFSSSGVAQKCYAWRSSTIVLFERSKGRCVVDTQTDQQTYAVTPQIVELYNRQQAHIQPKLIDTSASLPSFYDSATGQPVVWYARDQDGVLRLFDGPGFDPDSGEPLKGVTRRIVRELKRIAAKKATDAAAEAAQVTAPVANPTIAAPASAAEVAPAASPSGDQTPPT